MAWKPVMIVDALEEFERVVFIDAGIELVRPLHFVRKSLDTLGYFIAAESKLNWLILVFF
jgi:hypothetical protein